MSNVKKGLMLLVWRFQQINSLIIIVGLALTLTLQIYPYIGWRFEVLGIPHDWDWLIILIIFIIIFSGAVIIGILYDTVFKFWIQQQVVIIERNPFAKEKMPPKGILNRRYFWIPILRKTGLTREAEVMNSWVEKNMDSDPLVRKDVDRVIRWINEYELKPADKRWLKDVESIVYKHYAPNTKDIIKK
jgi:hypothetical protein